MAGAERGRDKVTANLGRTCGRVDGFEPGDLLSLGSFSRQLPPQPGRTVRAVDEALPGDPAVSVRFRRGD